MTGVRHPVRRPRHVRRASPATRCTPRSGNARARCCTSAWRTRPTSRSSRRPPRTSSPSSRTGWPMTCSPRRCWSTPDRWSSRPRCTRACGQHPRDPGNVADARRRAASRSSGRSTARSPTATRAWGGWPSPRTSCGRRGARRASTVPWPRQLGGPPRPRRPPGPTHEPIDPVRFIGNRSSGKMGVASRPRRSPRGARVTLVLGPGAVRPAGGVEVVRVKTAEEMRDGRHGDADDADAVVMAAAVADFRPKARGRPQAQEGRRRPGAPARAHPRHPGRAG